MRSLDCKHALFGLKTNISLSENSPSLFDLIPKIFVIAKNDIWYSQKNRKKIWLEI